MSPNDEVQPSAHPARAVGESARSDPLLEALVGRPREEVRAHGAGADAVRLVNLVDSAVVNSAPAVIYVGTEKASKVKKPRGHRRIDWVNTIVAGVAVIVVATTAIFAGVQVASADPAADAIEILADDQASLTGAENSLKAATTRVEESIATGHADAALIRTALDELGATNERAGTADPAALTSAIQAVDAYRAGLDQVVVPTAPAPYERGTVDEESLASVAEAINQIHEASAALDDAASELRSARTAIDALSTTYAGQLSIFAQTLTEFATAENEAHPVAGQTFRDAVTAATNAVTAAPLSGASGAAAFTAFRDAVLTLREEDRRAREDEEREREQPQNNQPTPTPDPSEPG